MSFTCASRRTAWSYASRARRPAGGGPTSSCRASAAKTPARYARPARSPRSSIVTGKDFGGGRVPADHRRRHHRGPADRGRGLRNPARQRRAAAARRAVAPTERLPPRGLRARFITEATLNGALDEQIMPHSQQSRPARRAAIAGARRGRRSRPAARPVSHRRGNASSGVR